ncbi:MAG: prepilin-type N-terminal cleavage/methylation domain-containing protein [Planctomycetota bacterium]
MTLLTLRSMQVNRERNALTLVELLIVLAVISLLAGVALPTVKSSLKNQRVTRAASLLQSAIQEGRARAIVNGGGGIIIERIGVENIQERSQATILRMAESPPAYTGDSAGATVRYQFLPDGTIAGPIDNPDGSRSDDSLPSAPADPFRDYHLLLIDGKLEPQILRSARDLANDVTQETLINLGDIIRLSNARYPFRIERIIEIDDTNSPPWGFWNRDASETAPLDYGTPSGAYVMIEMSPFEVNVNMRRHSRRDQEFSISKAPRPAIAAPIEMGRGTAIDLTASGLGRYGNEFSPMWIDGNYVDTALAPFTATPRDYESIYILFGARGEVTRIVTALSSGSPPVPQLVDLPVTGDIHFLVGHAGQTKTNPTEQLEDNDPNPLNDESRDGKTPLLDGESIWVSIKVKNGEVTTSPLIDPTANTLNLIPPQVGSPSNATQQNRIRTVIGRTRALAVESAGEGQ